ncbi:MAG: hypothetical protein ACYTG2_03785 [Planctomycetota bacterium]|jgi:hypothetical protein
MGRGRAVGLSIAAVLLGVLALRVAARETFPLRVVERWEQAHPDPRPMGGTDVRVVSAMGSEERRMDLVLLFTGLAVGCAVVAARPALTTLAGGTLTAVLAVGSIAVGLGGLGSSAVSQGRDALDGGWSLSDDVLPRLAGPHADTLRAWRDRIDEGDDVLLLGSDPRLWNAVLWALHPRAIHPRVLDVPREMSTDEIAAAARRVVPRPGVACWVIDLGVLKSPRGAGHPALVKVDG